MKNTPAVMSLFIRDLEVSSSGSPGRALMGFIESLGLDTMGASRALELAVQLQEPSIELDVLVGQYLGASSDQPHLTSFVLVACAPTVIAACLHHLGDTLSQDFQDDLRCQLLENLRCVSELPVELRRRWLAAQSVIVTRSLTRAPKGGRIESVELNDSCDRAAPAQFDSHLDRRLELLMDAVRSNVVREQDLDVLMQTRVDGISLDEFAQSKGVSYKAAHKHRSLAERQLRSLVARAEAEDNS
jgi:hypothetical protein